MFLKKSVAATGSRLPDIHDGPENLKPGIH